MNKIYKIIWSKVTGQFVVTSELAKGQKKATSVEKQTSLQKKISLRKTVIASLVLSSCFASNLVLAYTGDGGSASRSNLDIAIGKGSKASGSFTNSAVALGNNAIAEGDQALALGSLTNAKASQAIALGNNINATGYSSIAIGGDDIGDARNDTVGLSADVRSLLTTYTKKTISFLGTNSTAIGSIAVGMGAQATKDLSLALGIYSNVSGIMAVAIGTGSVATETSSTALGAGSMASAVNATALGAVANVSAENALALGYNATASNVNSVALGANSSTAATVSTSNFEVGGMTYDNFAGINPNSTVSVGASGSERTITNVAAGRVSSSSTDAINGSQLYEVATNLGNVVSSIKGVLGGNAAVGADGTITMTNIGNTGKSTVHEAIAAAKTEVQAGSNTVVKQTTGATGQAIYTVHANATTVSANTTNLALTTTPTTDANGVKTTDYTLDLSDSVKTTLKQVETNKQNIANNTANISTNAGNIANNTANITTNANNISTLQSTVNTLSNGWKVGNNSSTEVATIKANNQVNFVDGNGTTANVATATNGANVSFNVNTSNLTVTPNTSNGGITSITAGMSGNAFVTASDLATALTTMASAVKENVTEGTGLNVTSSVDNNGATTYTVALSSDIQTKLNNATTGWEIQGNGTKVADVAPTSKVNFANGNGTTSSVSTNNGVSTVKYDVNTTTLTTNGSNVTVGQAGNYFATAESVANAINSATSSLSSVLNITGDNSSSGSVNLKSEKLAINGTSGYITTSASGQAVTIDLDSTAKTKLDNAADNNLSNLTSAGKDVVTGLITANGDSYTTVTTTGGSNGVAKNFAISVNVAEAIDNTVANNTNKVASAQAVYDAVTGAKTKVSVSDSTGILTLNKTESADLNANNYTLGIDSTKLKEAVGTTNLATEYAKADASNLTDANKTAWQNALAGITFEGDTGTASTRKLGETLTIKGGASSLSDNNIGVVSDGAGNLTVKLAKSLTGLQDITATGTVTADTLTGGTVNATDKLVVGNGNNATTLTSTGNGLDLGGSKLTNIANGSVTSGSKDAVTGGQLYDIQQKLDKGWNIQANSGTSTKVASGDTVNFVNGTGTTASVSANKGISTVKYDINTTTLTTNGSNVTAGDTGNSFVTANDIATAINSAVSNATGSLSSVLNMVGDNRTTGSIDLKNQTLSINGSSGYITTTVNNQTVTIDLDTTAKNKLDNAADQSLSNLNNAGKDVVTGLVTANGNNYTTVTTTGGSNGAAKNFAISVNVAEAIDNTTANNTNKVASAQAVYDAVTGAKTKVDVSDSTGILTLNKTESNDLTANSYTLSIDSDKLKAAAGTTNLATEYAKADASNLTDANKAAWQNALAGITFEGDTGTASTRKLGETLTIKGGNTTESDLSDGNIGVVSDGSGSLIVKLAKSLTGLQDITASGTVTASTLTGGTVNATDKLVVGNGANTTTFTNTGKGLDLGGSKLTNIADGTVAKGSKDVVTGGQLFTLQEEVNKANNATWTLAVDKTEGTATGSSEKIGADDTVTFIAGKNVNLSQSEGKIMISTSDDVTANSVTLNGKDGQNGADGSAKAALSVVGPNGSDATNGADGTKDVNGNSTTRMVYADANGTSHTVATLDDGLSFAANDGTDYAAKLNSKITIKGSDSNKIWGDFDAGQNIMTQVDAKGVITIALAKALSGLTSATFTGSGANTVINGNGMTITPTKADGTDGTSKVVSLTDKGLNNGGNTITNVGKAVNPTDAVNKQQMDDAISDASKWTLQTNGSDDQTITKDKTVNFANGTGTTVSSTTANNVTTIQVAVNKATLTTDANGTVKATDGNGGTADNSFVTGSDLVNAINNVANSLTNKGLTFAGDSGNATVALGNTVTIKGGADTDALTEDNIGVVADSSGTLTVKLAKDVDLSKDGSLTAGNTTVNNDGLTTKDANDTTTAVTGDGITITPVKDDGTVDPSKTVSLTSSGLNNGGNAITNVASGLDGTDIADATGDALNNVANVGDLKNVYTKLNDQLSDLKDTGFKVKGNTDDSTEDTVKLGETLNFSSSDNNLLIGTSDSGTNTVDIKLSDRVTIGSTDGKPVKVDGTNGTVSGLTNITWDADDITSGQAATEDQLKLVADDIKKSMGTDEDGNITKADGTPYTNADGSKLTVSQALTTYDVSGNTETTDNSMMSAIYRMNEQGIKFFHVNDGTKSTQGSDKNTIDSSASGSYSAAVGYKAVADAKNAIAMGSEANATGENSVALGNQTQASGQNAVAIGTSAQATGAQSIALGDGSQAKGTQSLAIGTGNVVSGNHSGAIGDPNTVTGDASYALGNDNTVSTNNTFVVGNNVTVTADNSVALGAETAITEGSKVGTVAKDRSGNAGNTTTAGTTGTVDSATVGNITYAGFAGATATGAVSVGASGSERRIQNVAAGEISATSTDAINGSQLHATNMQVAQNAQAINTISGNLNRLEKDMKAGVANAVAVASLPQVYAPGKSVFAIAGATYRGQNAVAVGVSSTMENGKVILKANASRDSRGKYAAGAGVGFIW
ncbi:YadA-like family protein [Basilea psittacipulmonis]|uniref:Uncharacterized protein n=1 Tax=Basilea psittacipulmonis DSM 24701 TaxID=1072685 RepID=A0A077DID5_9BURK|nr:YadA-like family protein [Basilea psittacipulmonis]AIL32933.1 hypothetical protein IX83_06045 [Basilea psittacipulmonis DSM 24701]